MDEYIRTAEPVGSKVIAEHAGLGCSSATIRNELAELVSMGYLEQPHTSAGRVPTPMGYRMYVNELMEKQRLSMEETEELNRRLNARLQELDVTIDNVSRLASQLTDYPALALTTRSAVTIKRFDIIYVDANTFIIVVMLSNNTVQNKLVHLPVSVTESMMRKLSSLFNASFTGVSEGQITLLMISAAERAADDTMGVTSVIAAFAIEVLTDADKPSAFVSGENRLLNQPEFRDPDKAHSLMNYLERGLCPPAGGGADEQRRGAGADRTGECGGGAERLERCGGKLRRGRQYPRADRHRRTDANGLFRGSGKAQRTGGRAVAQTRRGRSAAGGTAQ